ncbi:hypothetical protein ACLOJK_008771 [Asimina triloba]
MLHPKIAVMMVRGAATLPHGTGKTVRVAVFAEGAAAEEARAAGADVVGGDELIEEVKNGRGDEALEEVRDKEISFYAEKEARQFRGMPEKPRGRDFTIWEGVIMADDEDPLAYLGLL